MNYEKHSGIFIPKAGFYLWVIFILLGIIAYLDYRISVPGFVIFLFLVYYNYRSNYIRCKEITRYIENLTINIDRATKDTLLNFPMPLVVLEVDGTVIWYNSSSKEIFGGVELLEKTIHTFVKELDPNNIGNGQNNFSKEIVIGDKNYNVLGSFVKVDRKIDDDEFILLLYFVDNTELVKLKRRFNEEKVIIGLIVIDNYDDLMQSTDDANRPQMLAEIDSKINQWMKNTGGIVKKYERDRYLIIFEYKHMKEFEDKKFDILDSVKEINVGNKIPVTLSIGFGLNGDSLWENFKYASASIDIALGRGGDQVVIKDRKDFTFYGGKSRELEKRTRVKARVIAYALRELIDQASNVLIMGHKNCDIDCLGAAIGIYRVAKNRNKEVYIVLNSSNPTIDKFVSKIEKSNEYENIFIATTDALDKVSSKTLLIIVDTHRPKYTEAPELIRYTDQVVVIDHHRRGADYLQEAVLNYHETYASSTCELVTEILQYVEEKIKLKPIEAEALYAGIVVDTKNFTFKTGVRTFEAAAFLRRQGVDTVVVKQLFQNDIDTYINVSNTVKDAEIIMDSIAVSVCSPLIKNCALIAAQAADQLVNLEGVTAAFVMSIANGGVSISGRSLGDVNVQMILEKLGGGGHMTVAGAQLQGVTVEEAKEKLKNAILEYMEDYKKEES